MMLLIHSLIMSYLIKILDYVMMDFYVQFLVNAQVIIKHWYSYIFKVFKFHPRVRLPWKTDISHFIFHVLAIRVRHITYIGVRLYPHGISFL